jgi:DNA anti-recombination protein RmuC
LGTELYERLRGLASEMAVLGSQLERAVHAYNRAVGAWDTKAMPAARRLHEVGAGAADQMEQARLIDTAVRPPKL